MDVSMERELSTEELASMSGISVRTLHHYDSVDLLKPSYRSTGGKRLYGMQELLQLGEIRFWKRMGLSLEQIRLAMAASATGKHGMLLRQRKLIEDEIARLQQIAQELQALEPAIKQGFLSREKTERYVKTFADFVSEDLDLSESDLDAVSQQKVHQSVQQAVDEVRSMSPEALKALVEKGKADAAAWTDLLKQGLPPDHEQMQRSVQDFAHQRAQAYGIDYKEALATMLAHNNQSMANIDKLPASFRGGIDAEMLLRFKEAILIAQQRLAAS